jgi:hypothetical protein
MVHTSPLRDEVVARQQLAVSALRLEHVADFGQ